MRKQTPNEAAIVAEFKKVLSSLWNICELAYEDSTEEPTKTIGESHWFCDYFPDDLTCSLDEFVLEIAHYINHLDNPTAFSYACESEKCPGLLTVYRNGVHSTCPVCGLVQMVDDISAPRDHYEARATFGDNGRCNNCNDYARDCDCAPCDYCENLTEVGENGLCRICNHDQALEEYYDAID